jgi:putative ABC transport system permease protein
MALGDSPITLMRLVLVKAALLGLRGGTLGGVAGVVLAVILGPRLLDVTVSPPLMTPLFALAAAVGVSLAASYLPARTAARLDPCTCFREG